MNEIGGGLYIALFVEALGSSKTVKTEASGLHQPFGTFGLCVVVVWTVWWLVGGESRFSPNRRLVASRVDSRGLTTSSYAVPWPRRALPALPCLLLCCRRQRAAIYVTSQNVI